MATPSEPVLLDTNVLVYAMNADAREHETCRRVRDRALSRDLTACLTHQILFEYFAVVTNPSLFQSPLSPEEAASDVEQLSRAFAVLPSPNDLADRVVQLLRRTGFSGRHVFDVAIAATMLAHGVMRIYSFDEHFDRMPGVVRLVP